MSSPIDKERAKKATLKAYIIIGIIGYIYLFFAFFQAAAIAATNHRVSLLEALPQGMINVFIKPLGFLPINTDELGTFFALTLLGGALIAMSIATKNLRKHDNPETVNGSAHLMNEQELKGYNMKFSAPLGKVENNGKENMILSKDIRLAIDNRGTRRNCNILTIGGSGAGKSRFFVGPNILQANCNYVITDPSGELLQDYGKYLEDQGYDVKVFNLTDVYRSNHYNPFEYIKEEKDVFTLVEAFIKNTTPEGKGGGDPFWENSEKLLLTALILYLWHEYPPEQQTFSNVVMLLSAADIDEDDPDQKSRLDYLFDDLRKKDPENLAVQQYNKFKLGAGKTLKSILISVGVRMQAFDLSDIKYLTNTDDFDLYSLGDTKKAIFVIIPTADKTFNFLVSMFYSQIFSTLYTYCETNSQYGWKVVDPNGDNITVFHAKNEKASMDAKAKAVALQNEIMKKGTVIKYDKTKKLYAVLTKKSHTLITWRGKKEEAEKYAQSLSKINVEAYGRRCDYHIRFLLDEFANIGQIPSFNEKLATMRKYEISCSIILQALSQLKGLYKDDYNTIVANCDSVLFLGSADMETIKWIIEKLAKRTTTVENTSWGSGKSGGNTSYNKSSIELLTADQIQMMDDSEALVCIRGVRPYYGKKYDLTAHPMYKLSQDSAGAFYIPVAEEANTNIPLRLRNKQKQEENSKNLVQKNESKTTSIEEVINSFTEPSTVNGNINPYAPTDESTSPSGIPFDEFEKKKMDIRNKARKIDAQDAAAALDKEDEITLPENFGMDLMNALNIDESASADTIKEAIETIIQLEVLDENAEIGYSEV